MWFLSWRTELTCVFPCKQEGLFVRIKSDYLISKGSGFRKVRPLEYWQALLGIADPRVTVVHARSQLGYCVFRGDPAAVVEQAVRLCGWTEQAGGIQLSRCECAGHTDASLHCLGRGHF